MFEKLILCVRTEEVQRILNPNVFKPERPSILEGMTSTKSSSPTFVISLLKEAKIAFVPKSHCEEDDTWQQIIPYMICHEKGPAPKVFTYRRATGDPRLKGNKSLGVGGHLEPEDLQSNLCNTLIKGARRELREELGIESEYRIRLIGMVKNSDNVVGTVHLGIVLAVEIHNEEFVYGDEIEDPQWEQDNLMVKDNFERWSEIIYEEKINLTKNYPVLWSDIPESHPASTATEGQFRGTAVRLPITEWMGRQIGNLITGKSPTHTQIILSLDLDNAYDYNLARSIAKLLYPYNKELAKKLDQRLIAFGETISQDKLKGTDGTETK